MSGRTFVDTNALVYVHDHREPRKQQQASLLMNAGQLRPVISAHVLGEFSVTVTRELAAPIAPAAAAELARELGRLQVVQRDAPSCAPPSPRRSRRSCRTGTP